MKTLFKGLVTALVAFYALFNVLLFVIGVPLIVASIKPETLVCKNLDEVREQVLPVRTRFDWTVSHVAMPGILLARQVTLNSWSCMAVDWFNVPVK